MILKTIYDNNDNQDEPYKYFDIFVARLRFYSLYPVDNIRKESSKLWQDIIGKQAKLIMIQHSPFILKFYNQQLQNEEKYCQKTACICLGEFFQRIATNNEQALQQIRMMLSDIISNIYRIIGQNSELYLKQEAIQVLLKAIPYLEPQLTQNQMIQYLVFCIPDQDDKIRNDAIEGLKLILSNDQDSLFQVKESMLLQQNQTVQNFVIGHLNCMQNLIMNFVKQKPKLIDQSLNLIYQKFNQDKLNQNYQDQVWQLSDDIVKLMILNSSKTVAKNIFKNNISMILEQLLKSVQAQSQISQQFLKSLLELLGQKIFQDNIQLQLNPNQFEEIIKPFYSI